MKCVDESGNCLDDSIGPDYSGSGSGDYPGGHHGGPGIVCPEGYVSEFIFSALLIVMRDKRRSHKFSV